MTKRSDNQRVDKRGEAHLNLQLERYVVNAYENDFGIDFEVNLTTEADVEGDDLQQVTGEHFFIQLKSSAGFDSDESVYADLQTTHIEQYLDQPLPVVLAVYDDECEEIYWLVVQEFVWDELSQENEDWSEQTTVRIRIPRSRKLTDLNRLETAITRSQNRIIRNQSRDLSIGEGLSFSPDDFTEVERQRENDRLSYRGLTLVKARQQLKRGDFDEAEESISEISESDHDDQAKVKALFMEMMRRNPAHADQALEIAEYAQKAEELAHELDLEVDELIATVHKHVAGLFVILEKREEMMFTDAVQSLDEFGVSDYDLLRDMESRDLLIGELRAVEAINRALAMLLEGDYYYEYAVCLSPIIDYLSSRVMVNTLSPKEESGGDDELNPLVDQAVQLADYIPEPETEFNLRKSAAVYYYHTNNPDTAKELLKEARDLAEEIDDHVLVEDTDELLQRIEEQPDPYDHSDDGDDSNSVEDREEAAKQILELQGIDVDAGNDSDTGDYDPMERAAQLGVEDADPEEYYRHCEHLHLAYSPSYFGRMTGVGSIGTKTLWCKHGGGMSSASLTRMFSAFKDEYCKGCEHHCPRPDDWEFTDEFANQQVSHPEFQEFLEARDDALTPPEYDETS
ncbi:DUF4365 domain-containing protein (plasmid) [Halobacterium sp. NMX12-1]|uniref:DUF4365 domain-containing protein n=1 Tax=Halobacterium sp. NMX12-1 TaxID=3166650 RepID=A0AAU8CHJ4_9EURY